MTKIFSQHVDMVSDDDEQFQEKSTKLRWTH